MARFYNSRDKSRITLGLRMHEWRIWRACHILKHTRRWIIPHHCWHGLTHPMHGWWMDLSHDQRVGRRIWSRRRHRRRSARLRMHKITLQLRCRGGNRWRYWWSQRAIMAAARSANGAASRGSPIYGRRWRFSGWRLVVVVVVTVAAIAVGAANWWASCCSWRACLLLVKITHRIFFNVHIKNAKVTVLDLVTILHRNTLWGGACELKNETKFKS